MRQVLFYVPVNSSPKVNIMLDESHAAISRPIVVANDIVVCRIGIGGKILLNEVAGFICGKPEQ
jgi:hypothetical protein